MSKGINKVILVGNVGAAPELRYTPNNIAVTQLSIATTESWKDKASGENQDRTEWHKVVLFGRLAEITSEYVKKGSKVFIEGSLKTRKWSDAQGVEKYTTEIIASEMQLLDSRSSVTTDSNFEGANFSSGNNTSKMNEIEDDIPF